MAEGQSRDAGAGRTGVCRHCGALVGAGESRCMMCGTPVSQPREERAERAHAADPETVRFLRAVVTRPATFTFVFIAANVFLYLLMAFSAGSVDDVLLAYGAKRNDLIQAGQWWRFVTPVFLHVQIPGFGGLPVHLLVNMYGLYMLGPFVEKLYGSARFVVFWVLTGIAGVVASYLTVRPGLARGVGGFLFKAEDSPSAGASGALFGLIGVLFVFGLKYRHELPEGLKRAFGTGMLPTILINLFIGYVAKGAIDNAAHMGGLVAGMALALFFDYKRPGPRGTIAVAWHSAQVACLALVLVSFVMAALHFRDPVPPVSTLHGRDGEPLQKPVSVAQFVEAINAGQNGLANYFDNDDASTLPPVVEKLETTRGPSEGGDALRDELRGLLVRARDDAAAPLKPQERARRKKKLEEEFDAWQEHFRAWVEGEGTRLGVKLQKRAGESEGKK